MRRAHLLALFALLAPVVGGLASGSEPDARPPGALDAEWARRRPAVTLVLVGGQRGKMKPCGCVKPQLGGQERQAALADHLLRRAGGSFATVSLGASVAPGGVPRQTEAKAELYRHALAEVSGRALVLGTTDLRVTALIQCFEGEGLARPRPPVNVVPSPTSALVPATPGLPYVEFRVGELTVRALSVADPEDAEGLVAEGLAEGVIAPATALQALTPNSEVLWVVGAHLASGGLDALVAACRALGPCVVVDLSRSTGAVPRDRVPMGGEPLVVSFDEMGKEVGVLDLERDDAGTGWLMSYRAVPLDPKLEELDVESARRVSALFDEYRRIGREERWIDDVPRFDEGRATYVGSTRCVKCHEGIYQEWIRTPHARAMRTLREVDYHWDPECLTCHVQGPRRLDVGWVWDPSGFRDPDRTPHLGSVGCENCHGPGSLHIESPEDRSVWEPGGPNRARPGRDDCVRCHDPDNSAGFLSEFETRLGHVDHRSVPKDRRHTYPRSR